MAPDKMETLAARQPGFMGRARGFGYFRRNRYLQLDFRPCPQRKFSDHLLLTQQLARHTSMRIMQATTYDTRLIDYDQQHGRRIIPLPLTRKSLVG